MAVRRPTGRPRTVSDDFVRRLRDVHDAGMSPARIAADLNAAGLPGGHAGRWHAATIRKLLRRPSART
jgi:hypothetical protein